MFDQRYNTLIIYVVLRKLPTPLPVFGRLALPKIAPHPKTNSNPNPNAGKKLIGNSLPEGGGGGEGAIFPSLFLLLIFIVKFNGMIL